MWSYLALLSQMAIFPGLVLYSSCIPEDVSVNKKASIKNNIPIRNSGIGRGRRQSYQGHSLFICTICTFFITAVLLVVI